jgi:tetratricopeptide (TPR) repeat protein
MSQPDLRCQKCANPLALADTVCPRCATPVPAELRVPLFTARAEAFAAAEQWAEAARAAEVVTSYPMDPKDAKLWWRKRGSWLQRAGDPRLLDAAEAALAEALRLDDGDDLSHQLWIDLLQRRGRLDTARALYKKRLEADPEDAAAKKHLAALRLLEDFKMTGLPKVAGIAEAPDGFFMKLVRPTRGKMVSVGLALALSIALLTWRLLQQPDAAAPIAAAVPDGVDTVDSITKLASNPMDNMGSLMRIASDPTSNILQIVACVAYLYWGWKDRRGA